MNMSLLCGEILKRRQINEIRVTGISMEPALCDGDRITILKVLEYVNGDIIVFKYREEGLLVHRLVKKKNAYYCKGDNAFRLERVTFEDIIGKVIAINGNPVDNWPMWKINASYMVNQVFTKNRYDRVVTEQSLIYKIYSSLILRRKSLLIYREKRSKASCGGANGALMNIFEPERDIPFLNDKIGERILDVLRVPCDIASLTDKVFTEYTDEIKDKIDIFIAFMLINGTIEIVDGMQDL